MGPFLFVVVAVVVVSVVVGAIAQFLNKLNEAAAAPPRPDGPRPAGAPAAGKDMDRFLAEIDRLRRKAAAEAAGEQPPPKPAKAEPVGRATPVAPVRDREAEREREREQRRRERERSRAKPAPKPEPAPPPSRRIEQPAKPPAAPGTRSSERVEELPVAPVLTGLAGVTGVPASNRVTRLADRARPAAKTDFAKNLTALLGSGQGAAMAVVLGEIFGPPKCKRRE